MNLIHASVLLIAIIYLLYKYFTRTFNYWKARNVKGPEPMVFFGNYYEEARRKKTVGAVLKEVYNQFPQEKVVGIYRMTTPALVLRDLDVIKNILIKDFNVFVDRGLEFSKEGLGTNLFHSNGATWKALRYQLTPIFTSGKLKNMFDLILNAAVKFMIELEQERQKNSEQEIHSLVQNYTLATISSCAFGLQIDSTKDKTEALRFIDENVSMVSFYSEVEMMFPGIFKKLNMSVFPKKVTQFFEELVQAAIQSRQGSNYNRKDLMELLLELKNKGVVSTNSREEMKERTIEITDSIIAAQAFIFYFGGFDTSAATLAFMSYELARNPDIQDKLIAEIDEELEKSGGKITYDIVNNLPYASKVFDETLRKYPVADFLQRNANVDYKIPDTSVIIEKGQMVFIPVMAIHHDEKYYPNPTKFDPERFNTKNSSDRHTCAYLPFGLGPRHCIGEYF